MTNHDSPPGAPPRLQGRSPRGARSSSARSGDVAWARKTEGSHGSHGDSWWTVVVYGCLWLWMCMVYGCLWWTVVVYGYELMVQIWRSVWMKIWIYGYSDGLCWLWVWMYGYSGTTIWFDDSWLTINISDFLSTFGSSIKWLPAQYVHRCTCRLRCSDWMGWP